MVAALAGARPRVVIVGAGFGGLAAARALRRTAVDVTLIDRHNYHLFQPLLYQVASGLLDPSEIAHPIRTVVRHARNVDVLLAEMTGIDVVGRRVITTSGVVPFDILVLATGSATNFFGIPHLEERATGLKDLPEALALRARVLRAFEHAATCTDSAERRRLLTFAVAGAGPTGVEFAGALAELFTHVLPKDFPRLDFGEVERCARRGRRSGARHVRAPPRTQRRAKAGAQRRAPAPRPYRQGCRRFGARSR